MIEERFIHEHLVISFSTRHTAAPESATVVKHEGSTSAASMPTAADPHLIRRGALAFKSCPHLYALSHTVPYSLRSSLPETFTPKLLRHPPWLDACSLIMLNRASRSSAGWWTPKTMPCKLSFPSSNARGHHYFCCYHHTVLYYTMLLTSLSYPVTCCTML